VIKLFQYPPALGLPNASPFCLKVETLLKMAGIPYELVNTIDRGKGPKGKLPAIDDGGKIIGDSELIRLHLERTYNVDFDAGFTPEQRSVAHAFARMLEERLYWIAAHDRWVLPENGAIIARAFLPTLPAPLVGPVLWFAARKIKRAMHHHGVGRHSREDMYAMGIADIRAVAAQLGGKPFFMGEEPKGIDAVIYAFMAQLLVPNVRSPLNEETRRQANIVAYCERMKARFFP